MPVLAEETVRRAASVKYRQVVVSGMLIPLADPIGYAIRRQRIAVPSEKTTIWCSCKVSQSSIAHYSQPAKTAFTLADNAFVTAQNTLYAVRITRRFNRKTEFLPRFDVSRLDMRLGSLELVL